MGSWRDSSPREVFSQAVPSITSEHRYVHLGDMFRYCDAVTLASAASQDYLLTTGAGSWAHLRCMLDGSSITSFFLFEGADRTGTTAQTAYNANRNSTKTPGLSITKGTSGGTTDGTQIAHYASGSAQGNSVSPSSPDFASEWVLKPSTKYLFRLTSGAADNRCNAFFEWYEHVSGT